MFIIILIRYYLLTPQQKLFIKNKGINTEMPISKWVKFLEPLCRFDRLADRCRPKQVRQKRSKKNKAPSMYPVFFFIAWISIFISIWMESVSPFLIIWGITIPFTIFKAIHTELLQRVDINNNVRQIIFPLLQVLAIEGGTKKKVRLAINFNKEKNFQEKIKRLKLNEPISKHNQFEILQLHCKLIDKTHFSLKVVDTVKTKTKQRYKLKRRIGMSMTFSRELYSPTSANTEIFKQKENKLVYKQTIKQSGESKTALIDIESILEKANTPYAYLLAEKNNL